MQRASSTPSRTSGCSICSRPGGRSSRAASPPSSRCCTSWSSSRGERRPPRRGDRDHRRGCADRHRPTRHVDADSCNGCEHELTLAASPYYDLQRHGFGVVASPRHADVLLVTGAVTTRMRGPLLAAYAAMPEPRRVAAFGDCALGCGILGLDSELAGPLDQIVPVDVRIPGCPPTPDAIAGALAELCDRG